MENKSMLEDFASYAKHIQDGINMGGKSWAEGYWRETLKTRKIYKNVFDVDAILTAWGY